MRGWVGGGAGGGALSHAHTRDSRQRIGSRRAQRRQRSTAVALPPAARGAHLWRAVLPRLDVLRELAVCPAGVAKVHNLAAHAQQPRLQLLLVHLAPAQGERAGRGGVGGAQHRRAAPRVGWAGKGGIVRCHARPSTALQRLTGALPFPGLPSQSQAPPAHLEQAAVGGAARLHRLGQHHILGLQVCSGSTATCMCMCVRCESCRPASQARSHNHRRKWRCWAWLAGRAPPSKRPAPARAHPCAQSGT